MESEYNTELVYYTYRMKSRYLTIGLLLAAWLATPAATIAVGTEAVTNFAQTATLERSGSYNVTDEIDYDFADTPPHDVVQTIPLSYHDNQGREFRMDFKLTAALVDGQPVALTPVVTESAVRLNLPFGTSTAATRHYSLRYTLSPVVLEGVDQDILKLSVTGLGWSVPINRASLRLETHTAPTDNLTCYTGAQGSTNGSCEITQEGNVATITTDAALQPGDALSYFCDFPHASFTNYLISTEPSHSWTGLAVIATAILVLIVLVVVAAVWGLRRSRL